MQTSSRFLIGAFFILLFKDINCTSTENDQKFPEKARRSIPRGYQDVNHDSEVRAILIRCPQQKENEVFHSNPKSITNISALRAEAILQFPGYDNDETNYQSNVAKCRKKLVIYLKIRKASEESVEGPSYIIIDHVFDQLTGKKALLLNPYVLKIKQEPSLEMYGLKYIKTVNAEATEEVISKATSSNYTGCDDTSDNPTCEFAYYKDERVPYSQGFCCSCDAAVNAERQEGCHHGARNGSLNAWKPDESFRQPNKPFEKSETISESKINKVKESSLENRHGDKQLQNQSSCHLNVDKKKQVCVITAKCPSKVAKKKGRHHFGAKELKSSTCGGNKTLASTKSVSECTTTTTPHACTKRAEKNRKLGEDAACSKSNSTSDAGSGKSSTLKLETLKLDNCSQCTQSETTKPVDGSSTIDKLKKSEKTTPSNFSVSTEPTTTFCRSEMHTTSSNVTEEKSVNTVTVHTALTSPSTQLAQDMYTTAEEMKVHTTTEMDHTKQQSGNSTCPVKPTGTKDLSKKYQHFMPVDKPTKVTDSIKKANDSDAENYPTLKDGSKTYKSFSPKEKPSSVSQSTKGVEGPTEKCAISITESPQKGENTEKGTKENSSTPTSVTKNEVKMCTEKSTNPSVSLETGETQTQTKIQNDSESVSPSDTNLEPKIPIEKTKESYSAKSSDSLTPQINFATNAKWTDDKFNEGGKETGAKFASNSLLDTSRLDLKVNNLNREPLDLSTQDILKSVPLSPAEEILAEIKCELKENNCVKSNDYTDVSEDTNYKKKETIAKNIKNNLAESKTVSTPETLVDFDPNKVNYVSLSRSDSLSKDSEISKPWTQDEINVLILGSGQDLEIEPMLSRKRRKEASRENCEDDKSEPDDASCSSTKKSCSTESSCAKKTSKHHSTPHPHTTQKHATTTKHCKKHDKSTKQQKNTSHHANCTKYPIGPCLTECGETTTQSGVNNKKQNCSAESIKITGGNVGIKQPKTPSQILQLEKGKVFRSDKSKSSDKKCMWKKIFPAEEMKENYAYSPQSIHSEGHVNVDESVLDNSKPHRDVDTFPSMEDGKKIRINLDSFQENEESGPNIKNSLVTHPMRESQQADFAEAEEKHGKNKEGGFQFSNNLREDDGEAYVCASENNASEMKPRNSKSRAANSFTKEAGYTSYEDSILKEHKLLQTTDDHKFAPRRTLGNSDLSKKYGERINIPRTKLDCFNEPERRGLEGKCHSGKTIVNRKVALENLDQEAKVDTACGEQQVKTVISSDRKKSDECTAAENTSGSNSTNSDGKLIEPTIIHAKGAEGKPTNSSEHISTSEDNVDIDEKDLKNRTECIKMNPLSKMASITGKLKSLNKVINTTGSEPFIMSPSDARLKTHQQIDPPPATGEEKLDATLKELKKKILPLIEDAEDKKVIETEERSNHPKKSVSHPTASKRSEKATPLVGSIRNVVANDKNSDPNVSTGLTGSKLECGTGIKRSRVAESNKIQEEDDATANDKVGFVPHYISDQVPMEKAKMLDSKNAEKYKDKEKCKSAILNKKSSRAYGVNYFEQDGNAREEKLNERRKKSEPEERSYQELLAAIAADSKRKQIIEEKPVMDNINLGMDTPIYDGSNNIFENDYASFVEDEDHVESEEIIEHYHPDKKVKKKSIVNKDSLSCNSVGSSESDYLDSHDLDVDNDLQKKKQIEENRIKRNPHGAARKNHLKIPIPTPREDKEHANFCNQMKEKREKRHKSVHKSIESHKNEYTMFQIHVDDENGISSLKYGEEWNDPVDSSVHGRRQKRQVLASGHQCRGGQNCADRSTPPNVNPKTYHESAHCLRFSDLWYKVYKVSEPEIVHAIHIQVFEKRTKEDGSGEWHDHTHGKMVNLSSRNPKPLDFLPSLSMEYHSPDDCTGKFSLNASTLRLLIPQPVPKEKNKTYPQMAGGPGEYLLLDEKLVAGDGGACDVGGVAYEGFVHQKNRCGRPRGSCLKNQPVEFWRADIDARVKGRKGKYFLENFAAVPSDPIKTGNNDEKVLALEHRQKPDSYVSLELNADFNAIIRIGTSAQITEIHVDSTSPGVHSLTIMVSNTGLASSRYRARITDCPLEAPKEWSTVEGDLFNIPPQRDAKMELTLKGDLPAESVHCSVEVVNEEHSLVATRRFRIQLNDRCMCVWWCLCACIGTVDGLKCRPHSQAQHNAAGFQGGVPFTTHKGLDLDLATILLLAFVIVVIFLLFLGLLKAIIGLFCSPVGAWGIFVLVFGPVRLKQYYEPELEEEEVVYDQNGYPVNPVTGYHNVRAKSHPVQFIYNVVFFLGVVPAGLFKLVLRCCCAVSPTRSDDGEQEGGCDDSMCFDAYPSATAREIVATNYVLDEMGKAQGAFAANYVDIDNENTPLMRAASESRRHPRFTSKAEKMAKSLLKQNTTFRNFRDPFFGVEFPDNIPYCIRGTFTKEPNGFRWKPSGSPLLQYWTFDGDLKLMKHPKRLNRRQFELWYSTPEEMYEDNVLTKLPKGFCINVKFQDDVPMVEDEEVLLVD